MPIKTIDLLKSSEKISVNDTKEIWRLTIKFVRRFSKDTGLNQFSTAIELLTQFKECAKICLQYIETIDNLDKFNDYIFN